MPWNPSSQRLTAPLNIGRRGDVQLALKTNSPSLGGAIRHGTINKWAKWKPLKSTALSLDTDAARHAAGRTSSDTAIHYGVRGSFGAETKPSALHSCTYEYIGPANWTSSCRDRISDFVHPSQPQYYGYRADATMDLMASLTWIGERPNVIVLDQEPSVGSFVVSITYSPHSEEERKEMLSIYDFMDSDDNVNAFAPTDFYPCVLIGNKLHCLYRRVNGSVATAPSKLTQGVTEWLVSVPSSEFTAGTSSTLSVILVKCNSGTHISPGPDSAYDISNWITLGNSRDADAEQSWAAWFCPIPDGCGYAVAFASDSYAIPGYVVDNVVVNPTETGLMVTGNWEWDYEAETTTSLTATIYKTGQAGYSATQSKTPMPSIDTSRPNVGTVFLWEDFDNGSFIRNYMTETYNIDITTVVIATAHQYHPATKYYSGTVDIPGSGSSSGGGSTEIQ